MADPTNPYAQYATNPYAVYGTPRTPTPQTPAQATGDQLQNVRTQQEISSQPLQNENTQAEIRNKGLEAQLKQQQIQNPGGDTQGMSAGFYGRALYANQRYGKGVPPRSPVAQGLADILPQGIVNANTSPERQEAETFAKDFIAATLRKESGAAISPQEYASQYQRYFPMPGDSERTIADKAQLRETAIAGLRAAAGPLADRTDKQIADMLSAQVAPSQTEGGFDLQSDPRNTTLSPDQAAAYDSFWKANPNPTPDQLVNFVHSIGVPGAMPLEQAKAIIDAKRAGRGISHDVQITPDISGERGGDNPDRGNAAARGFGDAVTLGTFDKLRAGIETIQKPGTSFDENLAREYAISDYDQKNHPFFRFGGQMAGGAVLPMGEVGDLGNLSLKGAGYGAAYGLGSSRSVQDIPGNVAGGAITGAVVPQILGRVFRPKASGIDPLVDPVTGELNKPMDSMTPAERSAVMRDYGLKTQTPGMVGGRTARVIEQGMYNVPGSAGLMEDVYAPASRELRKSMQGVAQLFGKSKTLNEGGAQIQRGANEYMDRAKTVIGKAYEAIPISDKAQASQANTFSTLEQLTGRFQSNSELKAAMSDPKLNAYFRAFEGGNISWKDMKDFRSIIGEKIGEMTFGESSSKSDLRALYASLSQDMRDTASVQGPRALRAFERANTLNRQHEELVQGSLRRILGPDGNMTPENAAAAVQAMTQGGKKGGDLRTLAQVRAATIRSGAWDEIASTMIHLGGQPTKSEGREFNPETFVNWYSDMSEQARALLFKPEQRKALDGFVAMNQQLSRLRGMRNNSNTTPTMIGSGFTAGLGGTFAAGFVNPTAWLGTLGMMAGAGANYGMAKAWTNPVFLRLMTGFGRAAMTGNRNAVQSQVGRLAKFAATNPEFSEPVQAILRQISNDNFVTPLAADPNQEQRQQQPY